MIPIHFLSFIIVFVLTSSLWTSQEDIVQNDFIKSHALHHKEEECFDLSFQKIKKNPLFTEEELLSLKSVVLVGTFSKNPFYSFMLPTTLEVLDLSWNYIGFQRALTFFKPMILPSSLKVLNLAHNHMGSKGLVVLSQAGVLPLSLISLTLDANDMEDEGLMALSLCSLPCLEFLSLDNNAIGDKGFMALANSDLASSLKTLSLNYNTLDESLSVLTQSNKFPSLYTLNLHQNHFNTLDQMIVLKSSTFMTLKNLNLSANAIGDEGAYGLRKLQSSTLCSLNLSHSHIGNGGFMVLTEPGVLPLLKYLYLDMNCISNVGLMRLAQGGLPSTLKTLSIKHNQIGNRGFYALLKPGILPPLKKLDLTGNEINKLDMDMINIKQGTMFVLKNNPIKEYDKKALEHPFLKLIKITKS